VALVGRSGSGKTTIASLLSRFYDPTAGEIRIDGAPLMDLRLADLRAQIALVSQDVVLFNDTVANNIAYGRAQPPTPAELELVAEAAHALEFIRALPQGFDTLIGDRGVLLSGGQRQRLAIARAMLKDAPILILDEATSALDTESERHIQAALEELMASRTTLIIAHRLSTIENADRILVLMDGRIVEQGPHAELLALGGYYSRLHRLQFHDSEPGA
jgi:ATP-binding cassette, subfamily B, bacterial MsbA